MNNNLVNINLNLLMALDALLKEKNVTNAGKRLFITQSAMSNLLKQLRDLFKDELFIRGQASRLIPTSYALQLAPLVTDAIEKLSQVFKEPEVFVPSEVQGTFTIGLSDYTEYLFLPSLVKIMMKQAPCINLVIKHYTYIKSKNDFENDDIDLAVGVFHALPDTLISQSLYQENLVCMGAKDNPLLAKPISKKEFSKAKQLNIQYTETRSELRTERLLAETGCKCKAVVTVSNTMPALHALAGTDLIAVVLERIANQYCYQSTLAYQVFDFDITKIPVYLVWHPKHKNNAAHRWLRDLILEIAKTI